MNHLSTRSAVAGRGLAAAALALAVAAMNASQAQSLYDAATFRPLTADQKAFRVGDVVHVSSDGTNTRVSR